MAIRLTHEQSPMSIKAFSELVGLPPDTVRHNIRRLEKMLVENPINFTEDGI